MRILSLMLFCSLPNFLVAGDVVYYGIIKAIQYEQTNQPTPQMLATNACMFTAFVVGATNNLVTNATVKPSNATPLRQLVMDTNQVSWRFEERFQTQSAMDAVYPSGSVFNIVNYNLSMYGTNDGLRTASLNFFIVLIPVSYPPVPEITNLIAATSIDTTRDFTLGWKSLGGNQLSIVQLSILDLSSNVVYITPLPFQPGALDGTSLSATVPANTLPSGQELIGHLSVGNPGFPNTNSYAGATGVPALGRDTEFRLLTRRAPAMPVVQLTATAPGLNLRISGETGRLYQVQASPDLLTWSNIASFYGTTMPTNVMDTNASNGINFFRVKVGD